MQRIPGGVQLFRSPFVVEQLLAAIARHTHQRHVILRIVINASPRTRAFMANISYMLTGFARCISPTASVSSGNNTSRSDSSFPEGCRHHVCPHQENGLKSVLMDQPNDYLFLLAFSRAAFYSVSFDIFLRSFKSSSSPPIALSSHLRRL